MKYPSRIKPISYLKANAAEVLEQLARDREPLVKVLALGSQQVEQGRTVPARDVLSALRARTAETAGR
jgi:hypothetical protein